MPAGQTVDDQNRVRRLGRQRESLAFARAQVTHRRQDRNARRTHYVNPPIGYGVGQIKA